MKTLLTFTRNTLYALFRPMRKDETIAQFAWAVFLDGVTVIFLALLALSYIIAALVW